MRQLQGLLPLIDLYDAFIVDLWGVLHDGVAAFPAALDCLGRMKAAGKTIIILSNAPRRATAVAQRNQELGIPPDAADLVMSSGEMTWQDLKQRRDPWYAALGERCHHLGPERDHGMRDGLDFDFTADLSAADFILLTGALAAEDRIEDYHADLSLALKRGLPLVCANPDLEVIRGGKREICAGSIAQAYAEMGGEVRSHGKPDGAIYRTCLEGVGLGTDARLAGIGDSVRTDIAGVVGAGFDGIFVADGIHGAELGVDSSKGLNMDRLAALCARYGASPVAVLDRLRW